MSSSQDVEGGARAQQLFPALEPAHAKFSKRRLAVGSAALRRSLQSALADIKSPEKRYLDLIELKSPRWSIAALVRVGELYWQLADMLDGYPPPPGIQRLGDEAVIIYRDKLRLQSTPIRQRAFDAWKRADTRARELKAASPELESVRRQSEFHR